MKEYNIRKIAQLKDAIDSLKDGISEMNEGIYNLNNKLDRIIYEENRDRKN